MLLTYILKEKIEYSTSTQRKEQSIDTEEETESPEPDLPDLVDEEEYIKMESKLQPEKEHLVIKGIIKNETQKAILIEFEKKGEIWIPKSTIHSDFESNNDKPQKITIDTWILKKNGII